MSTNRSTCDDTEDLPTLDSSIRAIRAHGMLSPGSWSIAESIGPAIHNMRTLDFQSQDMSEFREHLTQLISQRFDVAPHAGRISAWLDREELRTQQAESSAGATGATGSALTNGSCDGEDTGTGTGSGLAPRNLE